MEVEEKNLMRAILEDVKSLTGKVEGMEGMLETLVEIYTDALYEVKEEYLEKLEEIRKEKGKVFSSIEEFDRYFK
ncbi:MAG: hypothetical protein JJE19_00135 [Methanosarcinales archaeon]|jgi:hypothetical protein|nr:hypothetical protein [Methanosarcinales archaeon]